MKKLNELPVEIQNKIKSVLRAYDECDVTFEYGEYHMGGICLKSSYGADHEYIGCYKASEVYTPEERTLNYVECFHDYPIQYKGKRDYRWLKTLSRNAKLGYDTDGNIVEI